MAEVPVRNLKKRRSKASSTIYYGISALSVLIALILWLLASTKGWVNPLFVPSPAAVWTAFLDIAREGYKGVSLAGHIGASMKRLFLALAAACITAVPLGILCGRLRWLRAIFDPFIEFYRPLPPLAYYSLLVLWFGITDTSKIILLFLGAFAPLFITTVYSSQRIPMDRIHGAKSLGASGWNISRRVTRSRMPTSNATTARYVTTGWGITCSSPSLRCKNTPHDGSGHTIMSDQIWPWEASPPNRSWPSRPDLYFW